MINNDGNDMIFSVLDDGYEVMGKCNHRSFSEFKFIFPRKITLYNKGIWRWRRDSDFSQIMI